MFHLHVSRNKTHGTGEQTSDTTCSCHDTSRWLLVWCRGWYSDLRFFIVMTVKHINWKKPPLNRVPTSDPVPMVWSILHRFQYFPDTLMPHHVFVNDELPFSWVLRVFLNLLNKFDLLVWDLHSMKCTHHREPAHYCSTTNSTPIPNSRGQIGTPCNDRICFCRSKTRKLGLISI